MIEAKIGLKGIYSFQIAKSDDRGEPIWETARKVGGDSPNLITDLGLERMANNTGYVNRCYVGSGNTPPQITDTSVENLVATSGAIQNPDSSNGRTSSPPYYVWLRNTYRFGTGAAAGNLSEVCVGWDATNGVFSRALILDQDGNPTTLTVLPDEILIVSYELRMYPPTEDFTGTVTIGGEEYEWTGRAGQVTTGSWSQTSSGQNMEFNQFGTVAAAYSGDIRGITSYPSGTAASETSKSLPGYVPGSLTRRVTATWGLTAANFGVRAVTIRSRTTEWQVGFDRPIPKTADDILSLTLGYTWGRRD